MSDLRTLPLRILLFVAIIVSAAVPPAMGQFEIADLAITKTDGVTTATPGGSVTYAITASNAGPDSVTGGTVADTFPPPLTCTWTCFGAGGGTCTAAGSGNINDTVNLPAGGSSTYTASCSVAASATGTLSNTATVSSSNSDPNSSNNSATDTDSLTPQADLAITKTDGVTAAAPGGSVTYTIVVSNAGPSNVSGVSVSDPLPAGTTACTWATGTITPGSGVSGPSSGSGPLATTVNLLAGGSVTFSFSCTISGAASGSLANTATVSLPAGVTDPNSANNSATDTDALASPDLAITKTDGVTTAVPGASVTYTIVVSNAGPSNVTGVSVSDPLPAGTTACTWSTTGSALGGGVTGPATGSGALATTVDLPAGGSVTFSFGCTIDPTATGSLANTATVSPPAGVTDPNPTNNSATDVDTLTPQADLAITKTDGVTTAVPGASVTYTIVVSNAGPSTANDVSVSDPLPAGTTACTWSTTGSALGGGVTGPASGSGALATTVDLPPGGSVTFSFGCTIDPTATGSLANTATVSPPAGVTDPNATNNSATDSDTLTLLTASLTATKTVSGTLEVGGTATYTVVITNIGTGPQGDNPGDEFTDVLPSTLALVSATATSGTALATVATNTVTWNGSIAAGASVTVTITATILASATGTTVSNQGNVLFDSDANNTNESSVPTDDPGQPGAADATTFAVAASVLAIPTLSGAALLLLASLLAGLGMLLVRRVVT